MTAFRRFLRKEAGPWSASTFLITLLILAPLVAVIGGVFQAGPKWDHVASTVLGGYVLNTAILLITVPALCLVFAIPPAWLVSSCEFPGRRIFEWGLVMPLAIPTYVSAFVYFQIPEQAIPLLVKIRTEHGVEAFRVAERVLRYGLLSVVMAGVLFPYLYITVRASFSQQRQAAIEVARTLGRGPFSVFMTIALPLARPAIVAGLSLVWMEVINDYGAVHFFGVPTLTEGIFRTWFGLGDRASALRIASLMMAGVVMVLAMEQWQRGRARFVSGSERTATLTRRKLGAGSSVLAILVCLIPLGIGLLFPVWRLSTWAWHSLPDFLASGMPARLGRSVALALGTSGVLTLVALLFAWTVRLHPGRWMRWVTRLGMIGYAAPGAVVAVGVMTALAAVDLLPGLRGGAGGSSLFLSGTVAAIGFAYLVRFLAVPYYPVSAGMTRVCGHLDEASRMLGRSPSHTFWRVNLPLIRGTALAAMMLVFVDILKELPLTMILRPANFDTLATTAFGLASEGRMHECSVPSLVIILAGAAGLVVLNHFMKAGEIMSDRLQFDHVSRKFAGTERAAVHEVSLTVEAGEVLALAGESGSGKTTLLRLAAGLEIPDAGEIRFGDRVVAGERIWLPPEKRKAGLVFQDGALFPHLTAARNIDYGLKGRSRTARRTRIGEMLTLVGLSGYDQRFPHQLSGGERQRLALARALAPGPRVILLDEPFSNLDPDLRRSLRREVHDILRLAGATAIIVTHDTEDALAVGDRIAVIRSGVIEQTGTPREIYHQPRNSYCARLFGPANRVELDGFGPRWIRPEDIKVSRGTEPEGAVRAMVVQVRDAGRNFEAQVQADGADEPWTVYLERAGDAVEGGTVWVTLPVSG